MNRPHLLIGGERSSGKTTLLNYLVSGNATSPFPRGVHGRLSLGNAVRYTGSEAVDSSGDCPIALRVSTSGTQRKEIEIRSSSIDCLSLLFETTHNLHQTILRSQQDDESTCLSLSITSNHKFTITSLVEIGAENLQTFCETGILSHQTDTKQLELPDIYVHLTSAIKPLAHIEREAILKFCSLNIPIILLVNKCDLADDANSLKEVEGLVSSFTTNQCGPWLSKYFCSFAKNRDSSSSALDIDAVAELIRQAIFSDVVEPNAEVAKTISSSNPFYGVGSHEELVLRYVSIVKALQKQFRPGSQELLEVRQAFAEMEKIYPSPTQPTSGESIELSVDSREDLGDDSALNGVSLQKSKSLQDEPESDLKEGATLHSDLPQMPTLTRARLSLKDLRTFDLTKFPLYKDEQELIGVWQVPIGNGRYRIGLIDRPPKQSQQESSKLAISTISTKPRQANEEEEEFRQLVAEMAPLRFTHSTQVSAYIVKHKLGQRYKHISGILQMELDGENFSFHGGFPPYIYARLCDALGLASKQSRARPQTFTPYADMVEHSQADPSSHLSELQDPGF
jgi:hypothetical protein